MTRLKVIEAGKHPISEKLRKLATDIESKELAVSTLVLIGLVEEEYAFVSPVGRVVSDATLVGCLELAKTEVIRATTV